MIEETYFQIHREYFEKLKNKMHEDAKRIVDMLLSGREKEACHMFSYHFRELWACFEKEDKNDHFADVVDDALPYNTVFNELKEKNKREYSGPARPRISGWLTELFVYYFVSRLVKTKDHSGRYIVLHSTRLSKYNHTPDISIVEKNPLDEKNRRVDSDRVKVVIEVKTIIPSKKNVDDIVKRKEMYEQRGVKFLLFVGEVSSKSKVESAPRMNKESVVAELEKRDKSRNWIFFPYESTLDKMVNSILKILQL